MSRKSSKNARRKFRNPVPSSEAALKRMQAAKPRDTAPEKALRSALHQMGLHFRVDEKPIKDLNRKADIIFRSAKVAVFVDGCFWHGCPIHGTQAKANAEFWQNKIEQNQARDLDTNKQLKKAGWRVVRVWEHADPVKVSHRIHDIVAKRKKNGYLKPPNKRLWRCPLCGRRFAKPKQAHSCRVHTIDDHFRGKAPTLRSLFDSLRSALAQSGPLRVDAVESTINLVSRQHFGGIAVRRDYLRVGFILARLYPLKK